MRLRRATIAVHGVPARKFTLRPDRVRFHPNMTHERIEKLLRLLRAEPHDVFCLYALAQEYAKNGDCERALDYFDRVLAVQPDHAYAHFHKARTLEAAGRADEARAVLRAALASISPEADPKAARELQEYLQSITP